MSDDYIRRERRRCVCGLSDHPVMQGSPYDDSGCYVMCPACGCRTQSYPFHSMAWRAWDSNEISADERNYTIYDYFEEDA